MQLRDISFPTLRENVAFDEVLFQLADNHPDIEYLRFWESPAYGIVLGRIGKEEEDVDKARAEADGIPVIRRSSGGGTVLQGKGCLNYAFILSKQRHPALNDLRASYAWISQHIIDALKPQGIDAVFHPISDIALKDGQKKFSGNAQRRGKTHLLHHGTLLYGFDLDLISNYLRMPKDIPDYRKARSHKDFVANIKLDVPAFKKSLCQTLGEAYLPQPLSPEEASSLKNSLK